METRFLQRASRRVSLRQGLYETVTASTARRWRAVSPALSTISRRALSSTAGRSEEWKQHMPLGGYYEAILSSPIPPPPPPSKATPRLSKDPEPKTGTAPVSAPGPPSDTQPTASSKSLDEMEKIREETRARAAVVFGSPLVGPAEKKAERQEERRSKSTLIAGVLVPPKPEEPDHCCMSGCVNCVWDRYGEEVEEWAAAKKEAAAALAKEKNEERGDKERRGVTLDKAREVLGGVQLGGEARSMDDDGGGSETNWVAPEEDLFKDVPVAILEFMKTEKKLKERQKAVKLAAKS